MRYLLLLPLLAGCAYTHEPSLVSKPADMAKYEADKTACRSEAERRQKASIKNHQTPLMGFGVLGAVISNEATKTDPNDDYYKTWMEMTDECLVKKGYKLKA